MSTEIKPRDRDAILMSLRAGVVPRIGLKHLLVGRAPEIQAVRKDLERVEGGGATVRFIIGSYGAGKSFFLNLTRMLALERKFVVAQADVTTERRLQGSGGVARALYVELMSNLTTRSRVEGGALSNIVERWITDATHDIQQAGGGDAEIAREIANRLKPLQDLVSGYDFATVITQYLKGFQTSNNSLMDSALRWLRGEYQSKTDARKDLGVRTIIDDSQVYDYLKLMAGFVKLAGFAGLLVNIDEMGVLSHRLNHAQSRNANYEAILRIVNDCLQGNASGIGFLFGGTDEFLNDKRRGMASYQALASRMSENRFAREGFKDLSGPVIPLGNLSAEEMYVLLHNIRTVFAAGEPGKTIIDDSGIQAFMAHCSSTLGADFFQTPRDAVKSFTDLLFILDQNPHADWRTLLTQSPITRLPDPDQSFLAEGDEETPIEAEGLETFRLS